MGSTKSGSASRMSTRTPELPTAKASGEKNKRKEIL